MDQTKRVEIQKNDETINCIVFNANVVYLTPKVWFLNVFFVKSIKFSCEKNRLSTTEKRMIVLLLCLLFQQRVKEKPHVIWQIENHLVVWIQIVKYQLKMPNYIQLKYLELFNLDFSFDKLKISVSE